MTGLTKIINRTMKKNILQKDGVKFAKTKIFRRVGGGVRERKNLMYRFFIEKFQ